MGLAIAVSVSAQTTTDEQQQQPPQKAKTTKTEENVQPGQTSKQNVQPTERERTRTKVDRNVNRNVNRPEERTRVNGEERIRADERHSGAPIDEQGGVSRSTTVFRNGTETHESLALRGKGFFCRFLTATKVLSATSRRAGPGVPHGGRQARRSLQT